MRSVPRATYLHFIRGPATPRLLRLLAVAGVLTAGSAAHAQTFRYVQLDVGQGDASAVIAPGGCAALFDGGPTGAGATIKSTLRSLGVTHLEFAVISHYDADHIGGMDEVASGADALAIDRVYDHGASS